VAPLRHIHRQVDVPAQHPKAHRAQAADDADAASYRSNAQDLVGSPDT